MKSLYNRNAFYTGSGKAGLSVFIFLGLLNVILPISLNLSGPLLNFVATMGFLWCWEAAGSRPDWWDSRRRTICVVWPVPVS